MVPGLVSHEPHSPVTHGRIDSRGPSRPKWQRRRDSFALDVQEGARKMEQTKRLSRHAVSRRNFLGTGLAVSAGAVGAALLPGLSAGAAGHLTQGDAAILRFLAALEILETDFWQQYNELGGIQDSEVPGGSGNKLYTNALAQLDADMAQYIHDNTEDEFTHFDFINHYLTANGSSAINLDRFRPLPGSHATGAHQAALRL